MVFELYREGTIREQIRVVNHKTRLNPDERRILSESNKLVPQSGGDNRFAYAFADGKAEYQSDEFQGARFYSAVAENITPVTKVIAQVPAITVSDNSDNGDLNTELGDYLTKLKTSLSVTKGKIVSEISVDLNIKIPGGAGDMGNMLSYVQRAQSKIEAQIKQIVHNITGVAEQDIKVSAKSSNGNNTESNTTIKIK